MVYYESGIQNTKEICLPYLNITALTIWAYLEKKKKRKEKVAWKKNEYEKGKVSDKISR